MSITFHVKPFNTHPTWDASYVEDFLRGTIDLGPFHSAFGQIPTDATLSVTILPDDDTLEISRLLLLYHEEVLPLPMPPTSAYDLHVGAKIKKWEHMYYSSEAIILPAVMDMHKKECEAMSKEVTRLPVDFAEGQVLAKLALVNRIYTGFSRSLWAWKACRSAYKPGTAPYILSWLGNILDVGIAGWDRLGNAASSPDNSGRARPPMAPSQESKLPVSYRRLIAYSQYQKLDEHDTSCTPIEKEVKVDE